MKSQDSELSLDERKNRDITEGIQDDKQLNKQESGTRISPIKADIDDDPLLLNDDYGDEGLIITSIGHGGSVRDRQNIYFQSQNEDFLDLGIPDLEFEPDEKNNETRISDSSSGSNDELLLEKSRKDSTMCIEINFNKTTSTSFEKSYTLRKYPSISLGNFHYKEDSESNFARDDDFVGSAPVGNGRWSTLKRKKIDLNDSNQNTNDHFNGLKNKEISEPSESIEIISDKKK